MVAWVKDFSTTYHKATGVYPIIYTTTDWWKTCTGNSAAFGKTNPLWIAHYSSSIGALPAGWGYTTFWQYADKGSLGPGDQDEFNGTLEGLKKYVSFFVMCFRKLAYPENGTDAFTQDRSRLSDDMDPGSMQVVDKVEPSYCIVSPHGHKHRIWKMRGCMWNVSPSIIIFWPRCASKSPYAMREGTGEPPGYKKGGR